MTTAPMNEAGTFRAATRGARCVTAALALVAALLLIGLNGCDGGKQGAAAAMQQRPPASVTVAPAISRDVPVYLDEIGRTVAINVVSVVPQVGGKVVAAHILDGAYVQKGQLLFEIDPAPFEAALAAAKASLAQSQAELVWAQADYKRTEELVKTNVASTLEHDQKKSALGVAEAKVQGGMAAVQTADLNLTYTKIYSPISGRAGVRMIDPGNVVKANDVPMLQIQQLDPIYAEFTVTENDMGTVRKYMARHGMNTGDEQDMGLKVLVDVPGDSARVLHALGATGNDEAGGAAAAQPSTQPTTQSSAQPREGVLTFMDNSVQSATGTVKLRATVPNSDRYFWPGQFVNVRLILTVRQNAVLIPAEAQQIGQQGPFVYVVKQTQVEDPQTKAMHPATVAEMRPIVPGQRQGNLMVVDQGVSAGENVIVSGQMMVSPNAPVTVTNQPTQTASAAGK